MVPLSIVYCSGQMSDWKLNVATCVVATIAGAIGAIGAIDAILGTAYELKVGPVQRTMHVGIVWS